MPWLLQHVFLSQGGMSLSPPFVVSLLSRYSSLFWQALAGAMILHLGAASRTIPQIATSFIVACETELMATLARQATREAVSGVQEIKRWSPKWGVFTLGWGGKIVRI